MVHAIVTHTDIDGVAAASVYLYLLNKPEYRLFFTEPFLLHRALNKVTSAYYERVAIIDLGINPVIYNRVLDYISLLRNYNIPISWYDHHVWNKEWIEDLSKMGVEVYVDKSTCATGVVAKYIRPTRTILNEEYIREIVNGVCAGDLWKFDHWLGSYYIRLIRRKDKDSWRKYVIGVLADGKTWSSEFESKVVEHLEKELQIYSSNMSFVEKHVDGLKIIVTEGCEDLENSFLASYIIGRYSADIAVIVSTDGKLSFRSREYDVREIALKLGGGGHVYAAGAKINIPWWIRLLSRVHGKALMVYVAELVARSIRR